MRRLLLIVLTSLLLLSGALVTPLHAACWTATYPDSNGTGGAFTQPVGVSYPIIYTNNTSAPIGLEFWFHVFWGGASSRTVVLPRVH